MWIVHVAVGYPSWTADHNLALRVLRVEQGSRRTGFSLLQEMIL